MEAVGLGAAGSDVDGGDSSSFLCGLGEEGEGVLNQNHEFQSPEYYCNAHQAVNDP